MATNNTRIVTSELDFSNIKNNLQNFLQGQSELSDYNFEGSTLSILLDILSYNTTYNALYTNLAVNESFLDSAVKRDSVVSRAFELGYLPRSSTASTANVNIVINTPIANQSAAMVLPRYTPFTTTVNGSSYTFYNLDNITVPLLNETYSFNNVVLREGTPLVQTYMVAAGARYIISNSNCDTTTIQVSVSDSANSTNITMYQQTNDILTVTGTSNVFFLKEISNGTYEIQFGNGNIGNPLINGNVVSINYLVTNQGLANGARTFSMLAASGAKVNSLGVSYGGDAPETVDEIKFNAPRSFAASNRAVTIEDYKSIIMSNYSNVNSINVWGGDDNKPPVYGKVFICIDPKTSGVLTPIEKINIQQTILKNTSVVTITPVFLDPTYLNIELNITIYYNPNVTNLSSADLTSAVTAVVWNYNNTTLQKFDSIFRYSKLLGLIDNVNTSIMSNITSLSVNTQINVAYNTQTTYTFSIENPIYTSGVPENSVISNGFYILGSTEIYYLKDDGLGNLDLYSMAQQSLIKAKQGSVDYLTGTVTISKITISRTVDTYLIIKMILASNDVVSVRDNIVQIDMKNIKVNAIADTISSGNSFGGTQYDFTSSR